MERSCGVTFLAYIILQISTFRMLDNEAFEISIGDSRILQNPPKQELSEFHYPNKYSTKDEMTLTKHGQN